MKILKIIAGILIFVGVFSGLGYGIYLDWKTYQTYHKALSELKDDRDWGKVFSPPKPMGEFKEMLPYTTPKAYRGFIAGMGGCHIFKDFDDCMKFMQGEENE